MRGKPLILIVDDEADNRAFLKGLLERQGFNVSAARQADEAIEATERSRSDLILSDVAMPGMSGMELCRRLKGSARTARIPVILMSGAHKDEKDQAEGIDEGADDYLLKPFTPRLLLAKINGVLRRFHAPEEFREILKEMGLTLDVQARVVMIGKKRLALTRKEFDLLTTFLRKRGRVLNHLFLLETVWGYDPAVYNDPHTVESHIYSLRCKLGPKLGQMIVNVPGVGYRFEKK
jgi:DNA-binding response OmpR family regulator